VKSQYWVLAFALILSQSPAAYAATQTATLSVPGMTCAACPITVKKALSRVDGVHSVSVNYEARQVTVSFDDAKTTVSALTKATADAGYPASAKEGSAK
jgi:mercuric ion binding protein